MRPSLAVNGNPTGVYVAQSIVVLTAEARSPRQDDGIVLPLCEASHATPFK